MLTVADMGEGGSKMAKKVLTYFMDGPIGECKVDWDESSKSISIRSIGHS